MNTPAPIARIQQIIGMPEHPCEAIVRNGAIICPYEEMEVQYFPEDAGLYLITKIGDSAELFGGYGARATASLYKGYLPVVTHKTQQQGCDLEQTVFACLLDGHTVIDGKEPLICMVRLNVRNTSTTDAVRLPVSIVLGNCIRKVNEDDPAEVAYNVDFLKRDTGFANLTEDGRLEPYPYELYAENNLLIARDRGVVFAPSTENGGEPTRDEEGHINGWRFDVQLAPGECKQITYRLPYLPLDINRAAVLRSLDFEHKLAEAVNVWDTLLDAGAQFSVPGTDIGDLWRAQTAKTFIMVDKQNKGSAELYGGEMYREWAGTYPDKLLYYTHLSPSLYEFIWAQEAAYWVMGMLDMQGYHREVERYFEVFFELQGVGTPGVRDTSLLPDPAVAASFMGTTPHSWLNSCGGVLSAIARHYLLTKNKEWIWEHKDSILSACRWIKDLRATTKHESYGTGYGILPAGQSTDATFSSDHLQWYYSDLGTLIGLREMLPVLKECGFAEYEEYKDEVADYELCFLKSIDGSIRDLEDFEEDISRYDFSDYKYAAALKSSLITEFEENGVPTIFKDAIIKKSEAEALGLKLFVPMSPQVNIPMRVPYLDNEFIYALCYASGVIDFSSSEPLFEGARHSGKDIWDCIVLMGKLANRYDIGQGRFSGANPYNDYFAKKFLDCDEGDDFCNIIRFIKRYACDDETYVMVETSGISLAENWFQPCPFALSMAAFRSWLRRAVLFEDYDNGKLVIGKAMPKEWVENAFTLEKPIVMTNAASYFGPVSLRYDAELVYNRIRVTVQLQDETRLPRQVEVRACHPYGGRISSVKLCGESYDGFDREKGIVQFDPANYKGREVTVEIHF